MKKFLKVLLIVIVLVASIGGTVYFFYSRLNPPINYFDNLYAFSHDESFNGKLTDVQAAIEQNTLIDDNRFELIDATNANLDAALDSLNNYLILSKEKKFNEKEIRPLYGILMDSKQNVLDAMDEYLNKTTAALPEMAFSTEADSVYQYFANYFIDYANFLLAFSSSLDVFELNTAVDLKFTMIDLYSRTCKSMFSSVISVGNLKRISSTNEDNMNYLNERFKINNSFIDAGENSFSHNINIFIEKYNLCNKDEFAKNLKSNAEKGSASSSVLEQVVGFYFKQIYGV